MKMLLTEKTKQEKIIDEVQKKRNLFGLGLTSLIAACGATDSATDSATDNTDNTDKDKDKDNTPEIDTRPETELTATKLTATTATVATAAIASNADGGASGRDDPAIKDLQVTVTEADRGATSGGGDLVLRIADGNNIYSAHASVYAGLTATDKHDLVVSSAGFGDATGPNVGKAGAMYIFWDIGSATAGTLTAADTLALKHLKIKGSTERAVTAHNLDFYHIGGVKDAEGNNQYDVAFVSNGTDINILWDVTKHATKEGETTVTLDTSPGILRILNIGEIRDGDVSFIKINNNDNYDIIITSGKNDSTYIVWDINNYYDAAATVATPAIDLSGVDPAANATHGLLKITELTEHVMTATMDNGEVGYTDIDGGGINDIAFVYDGNTYILFGEKVANRDEENGTAISHTVDLNAVANGDFYDKKTGDDRNAVTATVPAEKEGFFDLDLDGADGNGVVANVGYRFNVDDQNNLTTLAQIKTEYEAAVNPPAAGGALSEEAYWDIA